MIFGKTTTEKQAKFRSGIWFAWRPVQLKDGRWCWLQWVEYKWDSGWGGCWYDYTLPKNESGGRICHI